VTRSSAGTPDVRVRVEAHPQRHGRVRRHRHHRDLLGAGRTAPATAGLPTRCTRLLSDDTLAPVALDARRAVGSSDPRELRAVLSLGGIASRTATRTGAPESLRSGTEVVMRLP
jgi:hypothetical protein